MMFIKAAPNSHGFVSPRDLEQMWMDQFDWVYREMDYAVFPLTIHPDVCGRPQNLLMLERLFDHIQGHDGVEFAFIAVYLFVVYRVTQPFGAAAQAGFGIGQRIIQAGFMPIVALGFAAAPVAGQNFGARKAERVRETFRRAVMMVTGVTVGSSESLSASKPFESSEPDGLCHGPVPGAVGVQVVPRVVRRSQPTRVVWVTEGLVEVHDARGDAVGAVGRGRAAVALGGPAPHAARGHGGGCNGPTRPHRRAVQQGRHRSRHSSGPDRQPALGRGRRSTARTAASSCPAPSSSSIAPARASC